MTDEFGYAQRIEDVTEEHLGAVTTEEDLARFKEACRNYRDARRVTDAEAIDAVFGNGDFWARVLFWVGYGRS